MISGKEEQTNSTSPTVFCRPSEKRTREFAKSDLQIAKMTCDGSIEPAEQAEPLDAQMPSTSKPAKSAMLSAPRTTKEMMLARQSDTGISPLSLEARDLGLTISQPSIFSMAENKESASGNSFDFSKTGGFINLSSAAIKPIIPARFSVPARRSF